jgi:hypothetical protein
LNSPIVLEGYRWGKPANTALVRTVQRLSVRVQGCLPPHNFNVVPLRLSVGTALEDFWLVLKIQGVSIARTALHDSQQGKG